MSTPLRENTREGTDSWIFRAHNDGEPARRRGAGEVGVGGDEDVEVLTGVNGVTVDSLAQDF